jgi:hypothetical protein
MAKLGLIISLVLLANAAAAQPPAVESEPAPLPGASSPSYAMNWVVLDACGGGKANSAGFRVALTLGQNPVGAASGAAGRAELGFWPGANRELFRDGFESGNTSLWSSSVGGS